MKKHRDFFKVLGFFVLFVFSPLSIPKLDADDNVQLPETNRPSVEAALCKFTAYDNTEQLYLEYMPSNFDESKTTTLIIALHGHGSDLGQIFNGVHAEFNAVLDVAASHNAIVISPQYRGTTSWMGPAAENDVKQIIVEQKDKRKIDKVLITGASMGGSSSLTFASLHPELVDAVVAMNGTANHLEYERFQDAISDSFGGSKTEVPMEYKKRSAEYFPEKFLGKTLVITLGSLDTVVEPDSARRLALVLKKIGGDVLLIERENEGHRTGYSDAQRALEYAFSKFDTLEESIH